MKQSLKILMYGIILMLIIFSRVNAVQVLQSKAPAWVSQIQIPLTSSVNQRDVDDGYFYLLVDQQIDIASKTYYSNYVIALINDVGVQEASNIEINFDPTFQQLFIHSLSIKRNGETINKLKLNEIRLLQRETDLNSRIYDGSYTAFINISDVRPGDQIQYSYSIKGQNPIYNNRFYDEFDVSFGTPVSKIYHRIISENKRKLFYRNHLTTIEPIVKQQSGNTIYEWETSCVTPIVVESNTPGWLNPFGWIEISEFSNWEPLIKWAISLYEVNQPLSKEMIAWLSDLKNQPAEKKVLTVFQFVQHEVRYMGFEVGINSYKPRDPSLVFKQRFGDCKDKALLMCTMLKELGVKAYPNLVHTSRGKTINENLPSPWHFNHVTVCVELNEKKYWLDPTNSYQKGTLELIQYSTNGYTLILKPEETNIQLIKTTQISKIDIRETYVVMHHDSAVSLKVASSYFGQEADRIRYRLSSQAISAIEKDFTDYYKNLYGDAEMIGTIEIYDDSVNNVLNTYEEYALYNIIEHQSSGKKLMEINPSQVFNFIHYENSKRRKQPYALYHPLEVNQTIIALFPFTMNILEEEKTVTHDCFEYSYQMYNENYDQNVVLKYSYKTKSDEVNPDQIKSFIEKTEEVLKANVYNLYWHPNSSFSDYSDNMEGSNGTGSFFRQLKYMILGVILFLLLAIAYLSRVVKR